MPRYDLIVASLCSIFMLDSAYMMKEVAPLKKVFLVSMTDLLAFLPCFICFCSITAAPAPWIGGTILLMGSFSITCRSWSL